MKALKFLDREERIFITLMLAGVMLTVTGMVTAGLTGTTIEPSVHIVTVLIYGGALVSVTGWAIGIGYALSLIAPAPKRKRR